ncbi:MAG: hypothetical protein V1682_03400 [Candidatus Omnitrophota bacterium]
MRINKRNLSIAISIIFCAVVFLPTLVFAAASVTVSGTTWTIGPKKASTGTTSSQYTVSNDNSGGTENITIKVSNSTPAGWTPSTTSSPGTDQFVLQLTDSLGDVIIGTESTLFTDLADNATSAPFTLYFTTPTAGSTEGGQTITVTLTATNWEITWVCGAPFTVDHTDEGGVAPVDKTVTYGTIQSSLTGSSKCWITQNLGADHQASSVSDVTEASAGWYWQFNHKQGFKHDGATRTPSVTWLTGVPGYDHWLSENDPCSLLLGTGWRLPTGTEWNTADIDNAWSGQTDTFASELKIHRAGYLSETNGTLQVGGYYWSSTHEDLNIAHMLFIGAGDSYAVARTKAEGDSVRCLKD